MAEKNSVVAVYETHEQAASGVKALEKAGFDMKTLSILGKDFQAQENVVGYYNTGDRMKSWGKTGAFWGGLWGMLLGGAFFMIPGIGPVVMAGPIVSLLVGVLEGAAVAGGLSAVGGALASVGIPEDSVLKYETAIKANKFLLLVHGYPSDVNRAQGLLAATAATHSTVHGG